MKKIKIMLTAIAVVTVVGGALAFKAQNFGSSLRCSTDSASCPEITQNVTFTTGTAEIYCTNLDGNTLDCKSAKFE